MNRPVYYKHFETTSHWDTVLSTLITKNCNIRLTFWSTSKTEALMESEPAVSTLGLRTMDNGTCVRPGGCYSTIVNNGLERDAENNVNDLHVFSVRAGKRLFHWPKC